MADFINKKKKQIQKWWQRPATKSDRVFSAMLGVWAGMWIGGLGRIFFETPVPFGQIGYFGLYGAILGAISGAFFPKASRFLFYPFAFLGFSCGGT